MVLILFQMSVLQYVTFKERYMEGYTTWQVDMGYWFNMKWVLQSSGKENLHLKMSSAKWYWFCFGWVYYSMLLSRKDIWRDTQPGRLIWGTDSIWNEYYSLQVRRICIWKCHPQNGTDFVSDECITVCYFQGKIYGGIHNLAGWYGVLIQYEMSITVFR